MDKTISSIRKLLVFDILFLIIAFLGLYHIHKKADIPFAVVKQKDSLIISQKAQNISGINIGDKLASINGINVNSREGIEILTDGFEAGDIIKISSSHNSRTVISQIKLKRYYSDTYLYIVGIVALLFIIIPSISLIKAHDKKSTILFYWTCGGVALIMTTTWGYYNIQPHGLGHFIRIIFNFANTLSPVFFVHFILHFPINRLSKAKPLLTGLYAAAIFIALVQSAIFIIYCKNVTAGLIELYSSSQNAARYFSTLCVVISLAVFIYSYMTTRSIVARKKLKWILLGFFAGPVNYIMLWVLPQAILDKGLVPEEYIIIFMIAIPLSFAISIVKYHVFDIDLILSRGLVYSIAVGGFIFLYITIITFISTLIHSLDRSVISFLASMVIVFLFQPVKSKIQKFVDQKFFKVRYDYRIAVNKFMVSIKDCTTIKQLSDTFIKLTDELIPVERIGFFVYEPLEKRTVLKSGIGFDFLINRAIYFKSGRIDTTALKPAAFQNSIEPGVDITKERNRVFEKWGVALIIPIRSNSNELLGFIALGRKKSGHVFSIEDIDLLKRASDEASMAVEKIYLQENLNREIIEKAKLSELNELKSLFVSSVTHDLKTPLTSIKMFSELIQSNDNLPREKAVEYLQIIEGESGRLSRLIDNVLDLVKIEKGIKEYIFAGTDLNEVVQSTLRTMNYQFQLNEFAIEKDITGLPLIIKADRDAVSEAIINIISNSIKYSADKKKIKIRTFKSDGFAVVEIKDAGIGIPESDIENIFKPFYRIKSNSQSKVKGLGLGLSIVKHIIDAHGGKIGVDSAPDEGTSFTLMFPLMNS